MDIKNYLIHCYLYYELNESIISDDEFDKLCVRLLGNWHNTQSAYKKYISKNDLEAGTGFTLFYDHQTNKRNYPEEIITEAQTRLAKSQADQVTDYRVTTDDPEELYSDLVDAEDWFLFGLQVDYSFFLKCNKPKQEMALGVIERILEERKNESGNAPA